MKDGVTLYIKNESMYLQEFIDVLLENNYGVQLRKFIDEDTLYTMITILEKE